MEDVNAENHEEEVQVPPKEEAVSPSGEDAPDADEPGDNAAPEELAQYQQETPDQPDNVDQEG